MMENSNSVIVNEKLNETMVLEGSETDNIGYVRLPMTDRGFHDFINSLLGEPQTIQGTLYGSYIADMKYISNTHHMIQQRIQQQNKGTLIQFVAKIFFNDDSSVTINSFDDFFSYKEIKNNWPGQLEITWVYLIQFEDRLSPEKQSITLRFTSNEGIYTNFIEESRYIRGTRQTTNSIEYIIKHTARTWGVDIEFLLKSNLQTLMIQQPLRYRIAKHDSKIAVVLGIISFSICFVINNIYVSRYLSNISDTVLNELAYLQDIEHRIDYLALQVSTIPLYQFTTYNTVFLLLMVVACVLLAAIFHDALSQLNNRYSFIILNEDSVARRNVVEKVINSNIRKAVVILFVNILCGVIGNFLYGIVMQFATR